MGRTNPLMDFHRGWIQTSSGSTIFAQMAELQESPKTDHPLHPIGLAGLSSKFWSSVFESEDAA